MKPILFNTDMVRATLDGRQTVMRLVAKIPTHVTCLNGKCDHVFVRDDTISPRDVYTGFVCRICGYGVSFPHTRYPVGTSFIRPPYQPGDVLYVRETWCKYSNLEDDLVTPIANTEKYYYRADGENPTPFNTFLVQKDGRDEYRDYPLWRPSIHMPKEAARIFLRVTNVRVERLWNITEEQAMCEGAINNTGFIRSPGNEYAAPLHTARDDFKSIWDSTIKPADRDRYGWNANPWVWAIEFERISKEEAEREV